MFSKRLKQLRESSGTNKKQLAEKLRLPYTTYNNYETGSREPNSEMLIKLATFFNVSTDYLLGKSDDIYNKRIKHQNLLNKYDILDDHGKDMVDTVLDKEYSRSLEQQKQIENDIVEFIEVDYSDYPASAGTGLFMFDDIKTTTIEVPLNNITRIADLVIPVKGDSMEPMYDDGDMVAIEYRPTLEVGEIGIFIVDGEVYIKEFQKNKLVSLNPKYKPIYFNENTSIKFIGKVLGKIK